MNQDMHLAPVAANERIETMDVLRGFALLGILLMNIEGFVGPLMASLTGVSADMTGGDRWMDAAIYVLVQGKFITLFSLLFGMGFAVILERAQARGASGTALYARRLLALLGIGLVHGLLIWSGDILVSYALMGFVLLLFFKRTPVSRLPKWGVAAVLLPLVLLWMWAFGMYAAQFDPTAAAQMQKDLAEQDKQMAQMLEGQRLAYGSGTYLQAVAQRGVDVGFMMVGLIFFGTMVLGMFLFGAWFVRSGAIRDPGAHLPLFKRLLWAGLLVGLPLMLWSAWTHPTHSFSKMDFGIAAAQTAAQVANILMCFAYFSAIVLLMRHPAWRARLGWMAPAGRMALTNYLMQSVICTLIFYHYGLGFFEQLPRLWQPLFVLAVFLAQVLFSRWWLSKFRYGPMEWLWRWLTYLQRPQMRLADA